MRSKRTAEIESTQICEANMKIDFEFFLKVSSYVFFSRRKVCVRKKINVSIQPLMGSLLVIHFAVMGVEGSEVR